MRFKSVFPLCAIACFVFTGCTRTHVTFRPDGVALVNKHPFFPVGIWVYSLDKKVMSDLHRHRFNTVVGYGFTPKQMKFIGRNGMMAVPPSDKKFFPAVKSDSALLAWYLSDEPEGHHQTPAQLRAEYLQLKSVDPDHPFGIDHFLWEAMSQYKDCCDFTMTDVYPILPQRDGIIQNVGKYVDESHRLHGAGWPHWTFIQVFGGKESDNGKWAQPTPAEVRCMAFIALAHRATGILYFSYWPQARQTWASIATLNRDIERIVPWLVADGEELPASADGPVDLRVKKVGSGLLVIAVNHDPRPCDAAIHIDGLASARFWLPFEARTLRSDHGALHDHFEPFAEHVYLFNDPEPKR